MLNQKVTLFLTMMARLSQMQTLLIQQHHGRVVDSPGDNLLAEFAIRDHFFWEWPSGRSTSSSLKKELPLHRWGPFPFSS